MRKLLVAGIVLIAGMLLSAVTTTAQAEPPYSWTGFYVGANLGGGWGRSKSDVTLAHLVPGGAVDIPIGSTSTAMNGVLGGVGLGYNWQTGSLVLGLETDIQITGQRGKSQILDTVLVPDECLAPCTPAPPTPLTGTFDSTQRLPWFGTLRGRLGATPTDRSLVYVTGGLAYGEVRSDATFSVPPSGGVCTPGPCPTLANSAAGSFKQVKAGWVVGAGIEVAPTGNWTVKLEYLHIDFGDTTNTFASLVPPPFFGSFTIHSHVTDDVVRLGLNRRF
jgi:outer membrane immunogenic protein